MNGSTSASRVLTDADMVVQLEQALVSRTYTAQATGLLAARLSVSTDEAWKVLREVSSLSNQKLTMVARLIVHVHDGTGLHDDERGLAVCVTQVLDLAIERVSRRPLRMAATGERLST